MPKQPKQPKQNNQSAERELRVAKQQRFEIRANGDGSKTVQGYFAVFNSPSEDMGFREIIKPGAFKRSLRDNPDVLALYSHDVSSILGRTTSGTLELEEDSKGLRFTLKLPDTSLGRDLAVLMERGDISACSFGFATIDDDWNQVGNEVVRTLNEVVLFEGSIVAQPAYPATSASLRTAPAEIRAKLLGSKHDLSTDNEMRCACLCLPCAHGDCDECSASDCTEDGCSDCPMQDDADDERARRMDLITRRLRV